jgi:hypothetical protein
MSKLPFEIDAEEAKKKQDAFTQAQAKLVLVFLHDERGKELLKLWQQAARTRIPVDATIQQYAAHTAFRQFVQMIEDQIVIAQQVPGP